MPVTSTEHTIVLGGCMKFESEKYNMLIVHENGSPSRLILHGSIFISLVIASKTSPRPAYDYCTRVSYAWPTIADLKLG